MTKEEVLIMALFWGATVICSIKWHQTNLKIKQMKKITCQCSDVIKRTTYEKNYYIYFYTFTLKKEEYTISDQTRFKLFFFNPKINDFLTMYVDSKNPKKFVTPLDLEMQKVKMFLAIAFLIIPILISI